MGSSGDQQSPSATILRAIADAEGCEPAELEPSLYDAVDPDAIDALFGGDQPVGGRVEFTYCGYEVAVNGDGTVELSGSDGDD